MRATSSSRNELPSPAFDLFDVPSIPPEAGTIPVESGGGGLPSGVAGPGKGISFYRMAGRLFVLGGAATLFRFPTFGLPALLSAAVAGEFVSPWRWISRLYGTTLAAAISAQATSLFVTPFTWPLRFGFFFTLFGVGVLVYAAQMDDLS